MRNQASKPHYHKTGDQVVTLHVPVLDLTARESVGRTIREMRMNTDTPNLSGYNICCGVGSGDVDVVVVVVVVVVD
jgi:hypothetical protein